MASSAITGGIAGDAQGVDVASYQHPGGGAIGWTNVAAAGVQFAAVKATEGTYYRNPYALNDLAEAKAAGLAVDAYAFAIPNGNGGRQCDGTGELSSSLPGHRQQDRADLAGYRI